MGIELTTSVYVSGFPAGKTSIHPAVYLSGIVAGKLPMRPAVYIACVEAAPKTKVTADTRRDLVACVAADTRRTLPARITADTERQVVTPVAKLALDTVRTLVNDRIRDVAIALDTRRNVDLVHAEFDVARTLIQNVQAACDTHRSVAVPTKVTCRTRRVLKNRVAIAADTKIIIPYRLPVPDASHPLAPFHALGIRSFSFTLGELTLSDTFQLETKQPLLTKFKEAICLLANG